MDPFTALTVVAAAATGAAAVLTELGFVVAFGIGFTLYIPEGLLLPSAPHPETAVTSNACGDGGHLEVGIGWSPLGIK